MTFFIKPTSMGEQETFVLTSLMVLLFMVYFSTRFTSMFERGEAFFYLGAPITFNRLLFFFMLSGISIILPISLVVFDNSGIFLSRTLFIFMLSYIYFYFSLDVLIGLTFKNSYISVLALVFLFIFPLFTFQLFEASNHLSRVIPIFALSPQKPAVLIQY